jgi:UDPglucose 6-dehydrogenase
VTVAIIGMGVVGRAQAKLFGDVVTYDIADHDPYPAAEIERSEFAVIAVGTPQSSDGHADLTGVRDAFTALPNRLPVLIRSTVPPGTTNWLREQYRGRLVAHAPEFLTERPGAGRPDSADVPFMILGGREVARDYFRHRIEKVFPGEIHECSAIEAELAKYTANLYWAARVTFVNEMDAICARFGADWEQVRQAWLSDDRINPAYTSMAGFGPGFGGACWPKDLTALITASISAGYEPEFLDGIRKSNHRFRDA